METSKYKLTYKTIVMTLNFYLMHYLFTGAWASPSSSSLRALTKHYLDSMSSHYSCDSVNSSESEDLESLESVKMKLLETKKIEFNKEPLLKEKRKLHSMKPTTRKTSLKNMIIHIVDISHINLVLPQVDSLSSCYSHVDYLYLLGVMGRQADQRHGCHCLRQPRQLQEVLHPIQRCQQEAAPGHHSPVHQLGGRWHGYGRSH